MSTTVNYKGSTIATLSNETKTLTTSGKWMEANVVITDTSSGGTAAISVVDTTDSHGGTVRTITALDISDTTAVASDVASGKYFYTADGTKTAGTASGGGSGGASYTRTIVASQQTVTPTTTTSDGSTYYSAQLNLTSGLESGEEYIITYNGTEYFYTCRVLWGTNYLLGEINYFYGTTGLPYPFGILWGSGTTCRIACGDSTAVTVKIEKLEFVEDPYTQVVTGTVTGDGTTVLEIPCSFAPDIIYVHTDLSGNVSYRGIESFTLIKDSAFYVSFDSSTSSADTYAVYVDNIIGYNESEAATMPYATHSNNVLTIDMVNNSSAYRFASGITYTYELSTLGCTPSATAHSIYFEFSDNTNTTITAYYDSTFISDAITATTPTTYGNKTVTLAQLDNVTWYEPTNIPLNTQLIDYTKCLQDTIIDSGGQEETVQWYYASDYTNISSGMTFTLACGWWTYVAFYDSSKEFIQSFSVYDSGVLTQDSQDSNLGHGTLTGNTIPSNAEYVRISSTATNSNYMSLIRTA